MPYTKTIYKKDSSGKLRFLELTASGNLLIQKNGVLGSDKISERRTLITGKNKGKSNETTAHEQAILEVKSKIKKKLDKDYFESEENAKSEVVILPMLAKNAKDHMNKIDWSLPVYAQPKLDGIRAFIKDSDSMKSRDGKEITTLKHIQNALISSYTNYFLDGELYAHGLNFQENVRLIKKYRSGESENIKYHVYDLMVPSKPFSERFEMLKSTVVGLDHIQIVPTFQLKNPDDIKRIHKKFLSMGYEGTIIRHSDKGYECNKRSIQLLKYKDFLDVTARIIDVVPMDREPSQGTFILEWNGAKGHPYGDDIIGCGMKYSHKDREDILKNKEKYIGKTAELRFFEYSESGVPRFPVCYGIRLDK